MQLGGGKCGWSDFCLMEVNKDEEVIGDILSYTGGTNKITRNYLSARD